jgi:glycosyltransferase involved in cell wall biosynthesis
MPLPTSTHLVLIPSYNAGKKVLDTVKEALAVWSPVWVVIDGSTDGSETALQALALDNPALKVIVLTHNQGKGAAVLHGIELAQAQGYTHALTMDSDGQHPAQLITDFMSRSMAAPKDMILGKPEFDSSAPNLRVQGRKISNGWTNLETLWAGVGDSLFGFRVYPIAPLIQVMQGQRWMRRFDFDTEAVVRLCWRGVKPINVSAPVKYLTAAEGGVSHFNYWRDNKLLTWMHTRLCVGFLIRLPVLVWRRVLG